MRKKLIGILLIMLFFGTGFLPSISSDILTKDNYKDIFNTQKLEEYNTSKLSFLRVYEFGKISNLNIKENLTEFHAINVYQLLVTSDEYNGLTIVFRQFNDIDMHIGGFAFKGILKPKFICGYFYVPL